MAARSAWLWVCLGFGMSFCIGFFFFFFLLNCVGILGIHGGDGGDEW